MSHSPVGGSSAERFLECPGSVALIEKHGLKPEHDEDDTFSRPGTAAHALAEECLNNEDFEPWMAIGQTWEGIEVDKEMADAVAKYLTCVQDYHSDLYDTPDGEKLVEHKFHCSSLHEKMFGTSDLVVINGNRLDIWDYKHGVGIVKEAQGNPQLLYYAAGVMHDLNLWDTIDVVGLHIYQPRASHYKGPHRYWGVTADYVKEWLHNTLIPGMNRAFIDTTTVAGEHCRFCPMRFHKCEALVNASKDLEWYTDKVEEEGIASLTNEELAAMLDLGEVFKIVRSAAYKTALQRAEKGDKISGWTLGKKRANRKFKDGVEEAAREKFGNRVFKNELWSPAQIEKLAGGKEFTQEWSFTPSSGVALVKGKAKGGEIKGKKVKDVFKPKR